MGQHFLYGLGNGKEALFTPLYSTFEDSYIKGKTVCLLYYLLSSNAYSEWLNLASGKMIGKWSKKKVVHCSSQSGLMVRSKPLFVRFWLKAEKFTSAVEMDVFGSVDGEESRSLERLFDGMPLYLVNHTAKCFIDVRAQIFIHRVLESERPGEIDLMFDPLSFLLAESFDLEVELNKYANLVGIWSHHKMEVLPYLTLKAKNYSDKTVDLFFSEAKRFEKRDIGLVARGKAYSLYSASFGRKERKAKKSIGSKGGVVVEMMPCDTGSIEDVEIRFNELVQMGIKTLKAELGDN